MLKYLLIVCLPFNLIQAQTKTEQWFDYSFKPATGGARYYVITEKKGERWHREAYFIPEKSMAMDGWYGDEKCEKAEGEVKWYHPNKFLQSTVNYVGGKEEGIALHYHDNGMMKDSGNYVGGRLKGIKLGWDANGNPSDSLNFDGAGNGVDVQWFDNGVVAHAGRWENDTVKVNRWNYYQYNGKLLASEDYKEGKKIACHCFDETGKELDPSLCLREEEAYFPGHEKGWMNFLVNNLNSEVPAKKRAPEGAYTVIVQFVVDKDGAVKDITPLTHLGFGTEEEVVRILRKSPRWVPALQFGRNVRAYRKQPVTFMVSK